MRDKLKLTETLVALLPDAYKLSVAEARASWWYNLRNQGGLRLTQEGFETFVNVLDLEHHRVDLNPQKFDKRLLLALDKKLQFPYFIHTEKRMARSLSLFSSREAVLANLYNDLKKFLDNYQ